MNLVNNINFVFTNKWRILGVINQGANVVNSRVGGSVHLYNVNFGFGVHFGFRQITCDYPVESVSKNSSEGSLTSSFGAAQKIRMFDFIFCDGVLENLFDKNLTNNSVKICGTILIVPSHIF